MANCQRILLTIYEGRQNLSGKKKNVAWSLFQMNITQECGRTPGK